MNFSTNQPIANSANGAGSATLSARYVMSSKKSPCPVCGRTRDGDCRSMEAGNVILCHTHQDQAAPINGYQYIRKSDRGAGWGVWVWGEEKGRKYARPDRGETQTTFDYPGRDGKPLIRVHRQKGRSPEFYQSYYVNGAWYTASKVADSVKSQMRRSVPLYRYAEVRAAIDRGEAIVFCEGEKCADALWKIGIAATTSIGGSGAFSTWGEYTKDLDGAAIVVMMPDRDQVGIKYLETVMKALPIAGWIKCFPKSPVWDLTLPKNDGLDVADWIAEGAKKADVMALIDAVKNAAIDAPLDATAIAVSVETLIDQNLDDWIEEEELAKLGKSSGMDRKAFLSLVGAIRSRREIGETIERLNVEVNPTIDVASILPPRLAGMMQRDARLLGVDPIMLFHYLLCVLPAFLRKDTRLDIGGTLIPCIVWGVIVAKSGRGKTRAEKLICSFMTEQQKLSMKRYHEDKKQHDKDVAAARKNHADNEEEELQPPLLPRKYVFSVATIQGVVKNLKEQIDRGSVWARDELAGLFKSLGQFSKGDHEGNEILLSLWDCSDVIWDRADAENSFIAENPHMSIIGGLQPGKFKHVFKDPDDVDGLAARILFVMPREIHQKHKIGYCELSQYLPGFYTTVENLDLGTIRIDRAAYILWREKEFEARQMGRICGNGAMDAWLHKAPGHIGRIALGLHVIDCVEDPSKDPRTLTADTMRRAILFWEYCRACYDQILNTGASTSEIQVVLTKVLDKAIDMGGLSAREANQYVGAIATRAKEAGRTPTAYAYDLFSQLVEAGKGKVIQSGRTRKFIPLVCLSPDEQIAGGIAPESIAPPPVDDDEVPDEMPAPPAAPTPPENPFNETAPVEESPAVDQSEPDYFADESIADFIFLAQAAIDDGRPELIDAHLESIPQKIRARFKDVVMAGVILPTQTEAPAPESIPVEEVIQEKIDLNAPPPPIHDPNNPF